MSQSFLKRYYEKIEALAKALSKQSKKERQLEKYYKSAFEKIYKEFKIKKIFHIEKYEFLEKLRKYEEDVVKKAVEETLHVELLPGDHPDGVQLNLQGEIEMPFSQISFNEDKEFKNWQKSAPWRQEWLNGEIGGCYGFYH